MKPTACIVSRLCTSLPRVAVSLASILLVSVSPAEGSQQTVDGLLTIRLTSIAESSHAVDRAPRGQLSRGDKAFVRSVLRNPMHQFGRPAGVIVGHDDAVFTILSPPKALANVSVSLPGGTLRVYGRVTIGGSRGNVPVVGGTGRYARAQGIAEVRNLSGRAINVYRLRVP